MANMNKYCYDFGCSRYGNGGDFSPIRTRDS